MAWNRPNEDAAKPTPKKPSAMRGIVAGLVVVCALGGLCLWMVSGGDDAPNAKPDKERGRIKAVKHSVATSKVEAANVPTSNDVAAITATEPDEWNQCPRYPGEKLLHSISNVNNGGYIIDVTVDKNGKRTKHVREKPSMWRTAVDSIIATAIETEEGSELPPWPGMDRRMDKEFLRAVEKPIEILPTDTEDQKLRKQFVMSAREEILERIKNGEHFCDIMEDHRKLNNENGRIRRDALRELAKIRKTGTADDVDVYVTAVNQHFSKMGITPISAEKRQREDVDADAVEE